VSADCHVWLIRHAETEWSQAGRHTGSSDLPLLEAGREKARVVGERLAGATFARVLSSPLRRAVETCELAGYGDVAETRAELWEWDYGDYEGLSTAEVRERDPAWLVWYDGAPGGESPEDVGKRVDRLVAELVDACEAGGDVLIFGHGHSLPALAVRWVGLPIADGRLLALRTASLSRLGYRRELRVIDTWNDTAHLE
jgi:probable phosphoglycerate mutase